jgi:O-antigen ligase
MNYGFLFALPSYMGIHIGRKYLGHKWMFILEIISLFCLVIFSNRSVLLSLFMFIVALEMIHMKITAKKLAGIVLSSFAIFFPLVYIEKITNWLSIKLSNYGIYSYSIIHINYFFSSNNVEKLFSGRLSIWKNAKKLIADNPLFGSGTGVFQAINGVYTHNLYYDLMVQYGVIGLLFYGFLIFISAFKVLRSNENKRLLGVIFLFLWFPKLFLSVYFYKDIAFWLFLAIANIEELDRIKYDHE